MFCVAFMVQNIIYRYEFPFKPMLVTLKFNILFHFKQAYLYIVVRCIMRQWSFNNNYPFNLVFCSHSIQFTIYTTQAYSNDCLIMMGGVNTNVKGQRDKTQFLPFRTELPTVGLLSHMAMQSRAAQPILQIFTKVSIVAIFKYHLTLCLFVFSIDCNFFKRSKLFSQSQCC